MKTASLKSIAKRLGLSYKQVLKAYTNGMKKLKDPKVAAAYIEKWAAERKARKAA